MITLLTMFQLPINQINLIPHLHELPLLKTMHSLQPGNLLILFPPNSLQLQLQIILLPDDHIHLHSPLLLGHLLLRLLNQSLKLFVLGFEGVGLGCAVLHQR
jgi:hypothetical protein